MKHVYSIPLLSLLTLTSCLGSLETSTQSADIITVGQKLPEFRVQLHSGEWVGNDNLQGKPSVITFFNTACKDCQRELPEMQRVYADYAGQVQFLCISRAENDSSVTAYWKANSLSLPYSAQTDKTVYQLFANRTIPRVYVSDASGVVRKIFVEKMGEETLKSTLEELK